MQVDYGLLHFDSTLKMSGIFVNLACFILAALSLYELSRKVLKDEYLAYKAALYFCLNPASIFFR
jgi:phosphatidylinositol glycan class V